MMVANGTAYNLTLVARTEGDVTGLARQMDRVTASAQRTEAAMAKTNTASAGWVGNLKGAAAGLAAFIGVGGIAKFVLDSTTAFQQFDNAVQSFSGSTAVAGQAWNDVQEIAAKGFDINPLLRAEQSFLSLGKTLPEAKQFVETIAKIGSATDAAALERISLAFTQIAAKGKVSLEEIRQLGEAGVPALALFSKAAGLTTAEFQKAASLGQIYSNDVLPEVIKAVDELYGAAYANRENTIFGQIGGAKIDAQNLARVWGEELTPAVGIGMQALSGFLNVAQKVPPQMLLIGLAAYKLPVVAQQARLVGDAAQKMYLAWRVGARGGNEAIAGSIAALGKLKAGLIAAAAVAAGTLASGAFAPEEAANIDLVAASLKNLAEKQDITALSSIKYVDNIGEMMNIVNNPTLLKRSEDLAASIGGIIGVGPGRSKDTFEFLQNMKQIDGTLANMAKTGKEADAAKAFAFLREQIRPEDLQAFDASFKQYKGALAGIESGAIQAADATGELVDATKTLKDAQDRLAEAVVGPGNSFLESAKKMQAFADAIDKANDAVDKSKKVSNDERGALIDLAEAALEIAENQIKAGESVDTVVSKMKKSRSTFLEVADKMGLSATEAKRFADNAGLVPSDIRTKFKISGLSDLQAAEASVKGIYSTAGIGYSGGAAYNLYIQQQMKLIATQTIPVNVQNWPSSGGGSSTRTGSSAAPGGTGRIGPVARTVQTRMVSV
jgi:tape measure domain-containing protein